MKFRLRMQDPGSKAKTLLELLIEAANHAERGGAVFSFVTASGVRLLLDDSEFADFLSNESFDIIVGLDAVTGPDAITLLHEAGKIYHGLTVKAFLHQRGGVLFHPKFSWFAAGKWARVLIGSANLTRGGLLKNWEALGDVTLAKPRDIRSLTDSWRTWINANKKNILSIEDERVLERAAENVVEDRRRHEEDRVEDADMDLVTVEPDATVLLAEIPRGSDRWGQASFHLETFENFFQVQLGASHRLLLSPVDESGIVGELEVRPGVSVKSRNFRIELGQAAGKKYPDNGRPIGIFLRLGTRRFRYRLVMPGERDYDAACDILDNLYTGRPDRMREVKLTLDEFRATTPGTAL